MRKWLCGLSRCQGLPPRSTILLLFVMVDPKYSNLFSFSILLYTHMFLFSWIACCFHIYIYTHTHTHTHTQGVPGGNVPDFGRMFVKLKYTDITQNTYIRSWTVTEIMVREKCGLLAVPHTVPGLRVVLPIHCTCLSFTLQPGQAHSCCAFIINSCNCYS